MRSLNNSTPASCLATFIKPEKFFSLTRGFCSKNHKEAPIKAQRKSEAGCYDALRDVPRFLGDHMLKDVDFYAFGGLAWKGFLGRNQCFVEF